MWPSESLFSCISKNQTMKIPHSLLHQILRLDNPKLEYKEFTTNVPINIGYSIHVSTNYGTRPYSTLAVAIVQYPQEKKPSMPVGGVGVDWWSNTAFQHFLVMSFFKGRLDLNLFPPSFRVFGFQSLVDLRTFSTPFVMSLFPQFGNFLTLMFLDVNLDHHQCLCF